MQNQLSIGNIVKIGAMKFHEIEGGFGKGKKAMLVKEIATIHGRELFKVNQLINDNRKRFIDGQDILDIRANTFEVLGQKLGYTKQSFNQSKNIYILSERGYAKLLKIMDDELAWEKYDQLVDGYFQMRQAVKETPFLKLPKSKYRTLPPVNHSVEILQKVWLAAGVDSKRAAAAVFGIYKQVYSDIGIDIPGVPIQCEKTYDKEQIAKVLGIYSKTNKPHAQAVAAIIRTLNVPSEMIEHSPFATNGHSDDYDRYKAPVLDMVHDWLIAHGKPKLITLGKKYNVIYQ